MCGVWKKWLTYLRAAIPEAAWKWIEHPACVGAALNVEVERGQANGVETIAFIASGCANSRLCISMRVRQRL